MRKPNSVSTSLNEIGLHQLANTLKSIEALYKRSSTDLSKEREVFQTLLQIVLYFKDKSLDSVAEEPLKLPSYSIETPYKYIIYSGEDLSEYSKSDILSIGIPNFLSAFIKKYMRNRLDALSGSDAQRYEKLIEQASELTRVAQKSYRQIIAPTKHPKFKKPSQEYTRRDLSRLGSVFSDMALFREVIRKIYAPKYAHYIASSEQEYEEMMQESQKPQDLELDIPLTPSSSPSEDNTPDDSDDIEELLKERSQSGLRDLKSFLKITKKADFYPGGERQILNKLKSLTPEFDKIRDKIDNKYAQKLKMSVQEFRDFLNIEDLIQIRKRAATKDPKDKTLLDFIEYVPKQDLQEDLQSEELSQKIVRDVLRGIVHHEVSRSNILKKKKEKNRELYTPEQIFAAWEYLKNLVTVRYEVLVRNIINIALVMKEKEDLPQYEKTNLFKKEIDSKQIDLFLIEQLQKMVGELK